MTRPEKLFLTTHWSMYVRTWNKYNLYDLNVEPNLSATVVKSMIHIGAQTVAIWYRQARKDL